MSTWTKFGAAALGIALVVGCGDDEGTNPTGQQLSTSEKQALATALAQADANGAFGGFGSFASFVVQTVGAVGTLDASTNASVAVTDAVAEALSLGVSQVLGASYAGAVGFIVDFDYDVQGQTESGYFSGVVGWNGLTSSGVSELVAAGLVGLGSAPTSGSGTIGSTSTAFGAYYDGTNSFAATDGMVSITGGSFGGSTDCSQSAQGLTITCSYSAGSMGGSFEFNATGFPTGGSYTQSPVSFTGLPAVRMSISISG